jgi:hypothetical protein
MLRGVEVLQSQGSTVGETCRKIGVSEHTYYRWKKEYGRLHVDQANRLKELERENSRVKKLVVSYFPLGFRVYVVSPYSVFFDNLCGFFSPKRCATSPRKQPVFQYEPRMWLGLWLREVAVKPPEHMFEPLDPSVRAPAS